ncbi:MAG: hypothetical protein WC582_04095 [Patescibacteria group bacterium]
MCAFFLSTILGLSVWAFLGIIISPCLGFVFGTVIFVSTVAFPVSKDSISLVLGAITGMAACLFFFLSSLGFIVSVLSGIVAGVITAIFVRFHI